MNNDSHGGSQRVAADALGLTQPRTSDLMNGRMDKFSLDAPVNIAVRVGALTCDLQGQRPRPVVDPGEVHRGLSAGDLRVAGGLPDLQGRQVGPGGAGRPDLIGGQWLVSGWSVPMGGTVQGRRTWKRWAPDAYVRGGRHPLCVDQPTTSQAIPSPSRSRRLA